MQLVNTWLNNVSFLYFLSRDDLGEDIKGYIHFACPVYLSIIKTRVYSSHLNVQEGNDMKSRSASLSVKKLYVEENKR